MASSSDHAQSEEVAQEVLVEVWRTAPRYRPDRGAAMTWILTLAHRRAIDRVRSVDAAAAGITRPRNSLVHPSSTR